ncbi:hypothetical protein ABK040_007916 [Willaertia magna]
MQRTSIDNDQQSRQQDERVGLLNTSGGNNEEDEGTLNVYHTDHTISKSGKDSCVLPFILSIFLISIPLLWFLLIFQNVYLNAFNYTPEFEYIYKNGNRTESLNNFIETNVNQHFPLLLKKYGIAGASLGIISEENNKYEVKFFNFGERDINFQVNNTVTVDTAFQTGELSETMTVFGVMKLLQENKINFTAPINSFLKRWKLESDKSDSITIKHLLTHTSGLENTDPYEYFYGYVPTQIKKPTTLDNLLNIKLINAIGTVNLDRKVIGAEYGILQYLIEDVSGMNFTSFMDTLIDGLGMSDLSTYTVNDLGLARTLSECYGNYFYVIPNYLFTTSSAFGFYTTVSDYSKLIVNILDYNNSKIVEPEYVNEIFYPVNEIKDKAKYPRKMALGYIIEDLSDGSQSIYRRGSNLGWRAQMNVNRRHKQGYILLTNTETASDVLDIFDCYWHYQLIGDEKLNTCDRYNSSSLADLITIIITAVFAAVVFVFWLTLSCLVCHKKVPLTCSFPFMSNNWLEVVGSATIVVRAIIVVTIAVIYVSLMVFLHSDIYGISAYNAFFIVFATKYAPYHLPYTSLIFGFLSFTLICCALFIYRDSSINKKQKNYQLIN